MKILHCQTLQPESRDKTGVNAFTLEDTLTVLLIEMNGKVGNYRLKLLYTNANPNRQHVNAP
jgi:hypothetical protein